VAAAGLLALRISGALQGTPVLVSPDSGAELRRASGLNSVHPRTLTFAGERVYAIAGDVRQAVRLVEIDPASLDLKKQGEDDVQDGSLVWQNAGSLYAIVTVDGQARLGRFSPELERQALSSAAVHEAAAVFFREGKLLTQAADGSALVLNADTLGQ
jgi:hypothetical protein